MISILSKFRSYCRVFIINNFKLIYVLFMLKKSYKNTPTYSISKYYRETQEPNNSDLIYGELAVHSFLYLLMLIIKSKNIKIYDLGCGDGKLLLSAVLFFKNLHAMGIEKVEPLKNIGFNIAQLRLPEIKKNHSSLSFFQDSFLTKDISDGNIIYINGAALGKASWDVLNDRFRLLAPNSYIISVEYKINNALFSLIYMGIHSASWGKARVYIYQKKN